MLNFADIILLPALLVISLVASYEDIREGKIRNKWIKIGLIWGLCFFACLMVWNFVATPVTNFYYFDILGHPPGTPAPVFTVRPDFVIKSLVNLGSAALISFLMWRSNAWAAGDAKLFIVAALLIPLNHYQASYLPVFPSFVLLINSFCFFSIFMLISSAFYFFKKALLKTKKIYQLKLPDLKNTKITFHYDKMIIFVRKLSKGLLLPMLILLMFNFFQPVIKEIFSLDILPFLPLIFVALILFNNKFSQVLENKNIMKLFMAIFFLILIMSLFRSLSTTANLIIATAKSTFLFMIIFTLFQKSIDLYLLGVHYKSIPSSALVPKMFVDPKLLEESGIPGNKEYQRGGLSKEQAEAIKNTLLAKNIEIINIVLPYPFAPFIFAGVLITLFFDQSFINIIINLFR